LRTPLPSRWALGLLRTLGRPQVQALALVGGGLAALGAASWSPGRGDRLSASGFRPEERTQLSPGTEGRGPIAESRVSTLKDPHSPARLDLREAPSSASTDGGGPVPLFTAVNAADFLENVGREEPSPGARPFALSVVRTAPASADSNCHGWAFAGGRFWVMGQDVERILADNGYERVRDPEVGDLVVYRDASGGIVHTAKVRASAADGLVVHRDTSGKALHTATARVRGADELVLVESQWGSGGCFLHAPADQPYSQTWAFYRSPRRGHLLRGLENVLPKKYVPSQPTGLVGA